MQRKICAVSVDGREELVVVMVKAMVCRVMIGS